MMGVDENDPNYKSMEDREVPKVHLGRLGGRGRRGWVGHVYVHVLCHGGMTQCNTCTYVLYRSLLSPPMTIFLLRTSAFV
jgi:hypothetical protein